MAGLAYLAMTLSVSAVFRGLEPRIRTKLNRGRCRERHRCQSALPPGRGVGDGQALADRCAAGNRARRAAGTLRLYARGRRALSTAYIELFRGTPALVQMFFAFFGSPLVTGWQVSAFEAAILALALNSGEDFAEIVRGAWSIREQRNAGLALGLTVRQVLARRPTRSDLTIVARASASSRSWSRTPRSRR